MLSRTDRQKEGIKKWIKSGGRGTWVYATGFGKTWSAVQTIQLLLHSNPNAFIQIVVPTEVLKNQWIDDYINKYSLENNCSVDIINTVITRKITCDLLVLDEVHGYASEQFSKVFDTVTYSMILCLTGTLERLDGKEELIKKYAPVCDSVSMKEAIESNWVSPVKQYLVLLDIDLTEYKELDKKFNAYFAYFGWDYSAAMTCLQNWKYRNLYAKKTGRTPKEVLAMSADWMRCLQKRKQFVMSHPKKAEVCKRILEARKDKKCITFSATIQDAENLGVGKVIHSKRTKKQNEAVIKEFNEAESGVLCTSKAADVGVDIKGLSVGIIMSIDSSKIRKNQRVGRVCRFAPGKNAEMFILVLRGTQEQKWFSNSNTTNVTVINEEQLTQVLNGEDVHTRPHDIVEDPKFRF